MHAFTLTFDREACAEWRTCDNMFTFRVMAHAYWAARKVGRLFGLSVWMGGTHKSLFVFFVFTHLLRDFNPSLPSLIITIVILAIVIVFISFISIVVVSLFLNSDATVTTAAQQCNNSAVYSHALPSFPGTKTPGCFSFSRSKCGRGTASLFSYLYGQLAA